MGKRNFSQIRKNNPYIKLIPIVLFVIIITVISVGPTIRQSFGLYEQIGLRDFSLDYYREILSIKEFRDGFVYTFSYSLISSILSVLLGVILSFYVKNNRDKLVLDTMQLGIILPHMVVGVIIYQMLGNTGFISRLVYQLGLIENQQAFPLLVYDSYGIGVVLAFIYKEMCFVCFTIYFVLMRISDEYKSQAYLLGANKIQTFFKVTLPMIMPNIIYCFVTIFMYSLSSYELPVILGSAYPKSMAEISLNYYNSPVLEDRIYSMAINSILMVFGLIGFVLFAIAFNKMVDKEATYE